ncbi:hypothetical protein PROFUN_14102 [Planoprotostelium fungivorum]|uniref:Protein kinase domain-containing protein n=1 Tax=Planoprotostelium fungivorum TaxID=1890364 RepID=A0A2P6N201_9EUKA|nr:hypothetical protein PROFUN_14102 [Planoprotostelium fungivorum]
MPVNTKRVQRMSDVHLIVEVEDSLSAPGATVAEKCHSDMTMEELVNVVAKKLNIDESQTTDYGLSKWRQSDKYGVRKHTREMSSHWTIKEQKLKPGTILTFGRLPKNGILLTILYQDGLDEIKPRDTIVDRFSMTDTVADITEKIFHRMRDIGRITDGDVKDCSLLFFNRNKNHTSMDKVKLICEYTIQHRTPVIFRKRKREEVMIQVEIEQYEELSCARTVTTMCDVHCTISEVVDLVCKKNNVLIENSSDFYMCLSDRTKLRDTDTLSSHRLERGERLLLVQREDIQVNELSRSNAVILCERSSGPDMSDFYSEDSDRMYRGLEIENDLQRRICQILGTNVVEREEERSISDSSYTHRRALSHGLKAPPSTFREKNVEGEEKEEELSKERNYTFKCSPEQTDRITKLTSGGTMRALSATQFDTSWRLKGKEKEIIREEFTFSVENENEAKISTEPSPRMISAEVPKEAAPRRKRVNRPGALPPRKKEDDDLMMVCVFISPQRYYSIAVNQECTVRDVITAVKSRVKSVHPLHLMQMSLDTSEERILQEGENVKEIRDNWQGTKRFRFILQRSHSGEKRDTADWLKGSADSLGRSIHKRREEEDNAIIVGSSSLGTERGSSASKVWIAEGRLTREKKIGQGSFAKVYKGKLYGRDVAIKTLTGRIVKSNIDAFKTEMSVLMQGRVYTEAECVLGWLEENIWCISWVLLYTYCPNGSLHDMLRKSDETIDLQCALSWMSQAIKGIEILHKLEPPLVHRDIKSGNLLLDSQRNIKVCDFGLARVKSTMNAQTLAEVRGTMAFCPPEIYSGTPYSTKSDVYSIGMVFWEVVTRACVGSYVAPFSEYERVQFDFQILALSHEEGLRPSIHPLCPQDIKKVIELCWSSKVEERPDCEELTKILSEMEYFTETL